LEKKWEKIQKRFSPICVIIALFDAKYLVARFLDSVLEYAVIHLQLSVDGSGLGLKIDGGADALDGVERLFNAA